MQADSFYKHSGKAPVSGILLSLIVGSIGAVLLGALYGLIIAKSPFIYINIGITLIFGGCLGALLGKLAKTGKIRNAKILFLLALVISILALYVHWVMWLKLNTGAVFLDPVSVKGALSYIASLGAWSVFDLTPKGGWLWTIWFIEALIVIIVTAAISDDLTDMPFCEDVSSWSIETDFEHVFHPIESAENIKFPHDLLNQLKPLDTVVNQYGSVSVSTVDDSNLRCVTFNNVTVEMDKDEEKITKDPIVKYMLFDLGNYAKLMELLK